MPSRPSPSDPPELSIDPVIGWRTWRLVRDRSGRLVLASPALAFRWEPRQPSRATCAVVPSDAHRPPEPGCSCGFYTTSRIEHLPRAALGLPASGIGVVGTASMWGRVVEHAFGYRAELAYPDRLRLVCAQCFFPGGAGDPTRIVRTDASVLLPVCDRHGPVGDQEPVLLSPAELERELLATYAVDLLPAEELCLPDIPAIDPPPVPVVQARRPAGLLRTARSELDELRHSPVGWLGVAVLVLAFVVLRGLGVLGTPPAPTTVAPVPSPRAAGGPFPGAEQVVRPSTLPFVPVAPDDDQRFGLGFPCGRLLGTTVELLRCGRREVDLVGFAISPPAPARDCRPGQGYTRKGRFSVCWLAVPGSAGGRKLGMWGLPGVRWWDIRVRF